MRFNICKIGFLDCKCCAVYGIRTGRNCNIVNVNAVYRACINLKCKCKVAGSGCLVVRSYVTLNNICVVLSLHVCSVLHNELTGRFCFCACGAVNSVVVVVGIKCAVNIRSDHPVVCTCELNVFINVAFQNVKPLSVFGITKCLVGQTELFKDNRLADFCTVFTVYFEPEQVILNFAVLELKSPLVEVKVRSTEVYCVNGHQFFKVNTFSAVERIAGSCDVIVIAGGLVEEAFVTDRNHVVGVDGLNVLGHFLCPVVKDIICTLRVCGASGLVCKFPCKYRRFVLILSACVNVGVVQQSFDVILVPALEQVVGVEVCFCQVGITKLLSPLYILAHTTESIPVVGESNNELHIMLFSLIDCVVERFKTVLAFINNRLALSGVEILEVVSFLFTGAVIVV